MSEPMKSWTRAPLTSAIRALENLQRFCGKMNQAKNRTNPSERFKQFFIRFQLKLVVKHPIGDRAVCIDIFLERQRRNEQQKITVTIVRLNSEVQLFQPNSIRILDVCCPNK